MPLFFYGFVRVGQLVFLDARLSSESTCSLPQLVMMSSFLFERRRLCQVFRFDPNVRYSRISWTSLRSTFLFLHHLQGFLTRWSISVFLLDFRTVSHNLSALKGLVNVFQPLALVSNELVADLSWTAESWKLPIFRVNIRLSLFEKSFLVWGNLRFLKQTFCSFLVNFNWLLLKGAFVEIDWFLFNWLSQMNRIQTRHLFQYLCAISSTLLRWDVSQRRLSSLKLFLGVHTLKKEALRPVLVATFFLLSFRVELFLLDHLESFHVDLHVDSVYVHRSYALLVRTVQFFELRIRQVALSQRLLKRQLPWTARIKLLLEEAYLAIKCV